MVRSPPERVRSPPERERSIFSFQTIVDFVLILLGHALGLDHHDELLIVRANMLKHAKTEGFFQQRELRKTDTPHEVCVGMAAQIAVLKNESRCGFISLYFFNRSSSLDKSCPASLFRKCSGSQVASSYPTHFTRYWSFPRRRRWDKIFSTM